MRCLSVENLKSLLFKDCHDSWTEFIKCLVLGRKGDEDNATAVHVGTNGVITMVI